MSSPPQPEQPSLENGTKPTDSAQPSEHADKKRESVTKAFLSTLGTSREIGRPIKVHHEGRKPRPRTADEYEIPYDRESDRNHPYEKFRRNRYYRCLVTREIARYLDRRTFITVSVREALIYCVFLILIAIITFGSFSLEKFYLAESMIQRYTELEFDIEDFSNSEDHAVQHESHLAISFHQINTIEHVWFYQYHIGHNLLFKPFWNSKDNLFENKVLGLPQIRQVRVRNNTCDIRTGILNVNMTPTCFGEYTQYDEEMDNIGLPARSLTERLAKVNEWRSPYLTGSMPIGGTLATYSGGGYIALLYDADDAAQLNAALKSLKWYTRATRAIFIEFTIYNGNVNLFCLFKFIFEIPPTGGVIPSFRIYVKKLIRYDDSFDFFLLGCEIVCMMFVVFYTIQKIIEIKTLRMKLFKSFWNYVDIMVLVMSYMTFIYNLLLYINVQEKLPQLVDPEYENEYISFDLLLYLHIAYSRSFAILIAFAFLRLLKYFTIVQSMWQLQTTLSRALPDILSYFLLFFYFYFVFALIGVFLFGSQLEDFKSFLVALFSLMRYSIADFDYENLLQVNPILGYIFFFTYIFFIVFILASIFLAILVSKYQEVRSEVSIGGAKTFLKDMLMIWFLQLLGHMECPWLLSQIQREEFEEKVKSPMEHVRHYLRQSGYSELEIELFFKKYDITDSKIEAMDEKRISFRKGEREAPPPLSQKDIMRYIVIQKLDYLENHYQQASKLIDEFLKKLNKLDKK